MSRTHALAVVCALCAAWPAASRATGIEVAVHVGRTAPTFEQTLSYDPSASIPSTPGVSVRALGPLRLDAQGALAFSGGVTLFFAGPLGIEARVDGLEADLESLPAGYEVSVARPPIPAFDAQLELTGRDLRVERVQPVSLNLKLATSGPLRLSVSGGVTRMGSIRLAGTLAGELRPRGGFPVPVPSAQVALVAEAPPDLTEKGQYGVNAGLGLQIGLGPNLALSGEVRAFVFRERVLTWRAGAAPANVVEEVLQRELLARLEPIRFRPTFFSVNAGLALRF